VRNVFALQERFKFGGHVIGALVRVKSFDRDVAQSGVKCVGVNVCVCDVGHWQ